MFGSCSICQLARFVPIAAFMCLALLGATLRFTSLAQGSDASSRPYNNATGQIFSPSSHSSHTNSNRDSAAGKAPPTLPLFPPPACAYGTLPGTWDDGGVEGGKWRILSPACPTVNYLEALLRLQQGDGAPGSADATGSTGPAAAPDAAPPPLPLRLLLLSDSVDRHVVNNTCQKVRQDACRRSSSSC